jgi:hypothetical protein
MIIRVGFPAGVVFFFLAFYGSRFSARFLNALDKTGFDSEEPASV